MALGTGADMANKVAEVLSLQARIEQCEAAIGTARSSVSRIESPVPTGTESEPVQGGAMAAIDRCNQMMADLNERIGVIADKVGCL